MFLRPRERGRQGILALAADGTFDELPLAPVSVGSEDQPATDMAGYLRTVVASHDVQAEIQGSSTACRGQYVPVVDEQYVRPQVDGRKPPLELRGQLPVDRGGAPVEYACLGQGKGARAQADKAGTSCMGSAHRRP